MDKLVAQVPTETDMDEALMGMERIERFYDLKAVDIAKGFVGTKHFNISSGIEAAVASTKPWRMQAIILLLA
ncbi:uncharacterized protein [Drosophila tropicalis]|uniref:uncharacterized protein n=1 Tax=Drosophila tropicalis TaxID=46794 RepID=UPI0035AB84B8